jgi:hypothetical protein
LFTFLFVIVYNSYSVAVLGEISVDFSACHDVHLLSTLISVITVVHLWNLRWRYQHLCRTDVQQKYCAYNAAIVAAMAARMCEYNLQVTFHVNKACRLLSPEQGNALLTATSRILA